MLRKFVWSVTCACLLAGPSLAQNFTVWTGAVDDDWSKAGNWTSGVPDVVSRRAHIQKTSDTGNWPVIKTGANITHSSRVQAPANVSPADGTTMFGHLTIESGATITVGDDFLFGDADGTEVRPMVGSLNVAGSLSVAERMRFGRNDYMTLDVTVTGSMTQTVSDLDFVIGTGDNSDVNFTISGNGVVSVGGDLEMDIGGQLSLSGNGRLVLNEYTADDDPPVTKADLIALATGYAHNNLIQGLDDLYDGPEALTWIGNGVAYFEGPTSITLVAAVPEPATGSLMLLAGAIGIAAARRQRP